MDAFITKFEGTVERGLTVYPRRALREYGSFGYEIYAGEQLMGIVVLDGDTYAYLVEELPKVYRKN